MHFVELKSTLELKSKRNGIENGNFHAVLERPALCFSLYKSCKLKLGWVGIRKKEGFYCIIIFCPRYFFLAFGFTSMYSVLNTLSEYTYFCIFENITSYTSCLFLELSKAFSVSLRASLRYILHTMCVLTMIAMGKLIPHYRFQTKNLYFVLHLHPRPSSTVHQSKLASSSPKGYFHHLKYQKSK